MENNPKLRPLDFQPVYYQDQQMWYLRDPLHLTDLQLIFPAPMTPLLALLDGEHSAEEIHANFRRQIGEPIDYKIVSEALSRLDEACLLENERSKQAKEQLLAAYRSLPYRKPALAGQGYPQEASDLADYLDAFGRDRGQETQNEWPGRGIVSPHIDYDRGGKVYAKVWNEAATAVKAADLVIMFGTDHNGGLGTITLTRQPYATPFGVIDTDLDLIDKLEAAIGPEAAYAEELHHRQEHSIELSAVWMDHVARQNGGSTPPMVPILVGSFHHFLLTGGHPQEDERLKAFIDTLRRETAGRRVVAVASVDLAHVGPSFGDNFHMDQQRRIDLKIQDEALMAAAAAGDADKWYERIANVGDRNRICGFAPTYMLLRYLGATSGQIIAYDQCPADPQDNSLVSICGLLLE